MKTSLYVFVTRDEFVVRLILLHDFQERTIHWTT